MPKLSDNLDDFECKYNHITNIPNLPLTIRDINCSNNLLCRLPANIIKCIYLESIIYSHSTNTIKLTEEQEMFFDSIIGLYIY